MSDLNATPGILAARPLLVKMVLRDFQSKYIGSLLGLFWTFLNPLMLLVVFTFVFTVVFRAKFGDRAGFGPNALFILAAILPWLAFQEGLSRSTHALLEHRNLVTRVRFPTVILPAVPVLSAILGQLVGMGLLLALAVAFAERPGGGLILLPLLLVLQAAFTQGLAWMLSALHVFYRDVGHLIGVLLLVWMYATPIFYPAALVPERFRLVIALNPMAHLVEAYRRVLLQGGWPEPSGLLALAGASLFSLAAGYAVFRTWSPEMADRL